MKSPILHSAFEPAVRHLEETLRGLRTGRASTGLVESIQVDSYGTLMRLRDMAAITTPDPRTVQIEPWDKNLVSAVEKAITLAQIGIQPSTAGQIIRLSIPSLTEERRKELVKLVGKYLEEARIGIRTAREKILKDLKRRNDADELSDTEFERERAELQKHVDQATDAAEQSAKEKEQELLGI